MNEIENRINNNNDPTVFIKNKLNNKKQTIQTC